MSCTFFPSEQAKIVISYWIRINQSFKKDNKIIPKEISNLCLSFYKVNEVKIICFNLNGIRAAAKNGVEDYINSEDADIVCLSELKAKQHQNPCKFKQYQIIWNECTEIAGYSGTAILTKVKPLNIIKGIGVIDGQGRAITLEFKTFYLINAYVPSSGQNLKFKERRLKWDIAMKKWLSDLQKKKAIIWTGDLNVAVLDFDVYDGETNNRRQKTAGFTPYERENFRNIMHELNVVDSYRYFYANEREKHYTFFSARSRGHNMKKENKGWRLDYFIVSRSIMDIVEDVQIRKDINCSDHVPVLLLMRNPNSALVCDATNDKKKNL